MRYASLLVVLAQPAHAHHEAVAISILPGLVVWLAPVAVALVTAWRRMARRGRLQRDQRSMTEN
ncbi:MAG: hypothetical protein AAF088_02460 [Pseudomonadota bacterium]